jgi:hypothetical protein
MDVMMEGREVREGVQGEGIVARRCGCGEVRESCTRLWCGAVSVCVLVVLLLCMRWSLSRRMIEQQPTRIESVHRHPRRSFLHPRQCHSSPPSSFLTIHFSHLSRHHQPTLETFTSHQNATFTPFPDHHIVCLCAPFLSFFTLHRLM